MNKGTTENVTNRAPYNVFRRVFRMFTNTWELIMFIVISTSGQISVLLPELALDPSRRSEGSNRFIENFSLVQTYSANSRETKFINSAMFPNDKGVKNWKEFLKSNFRIEEYFKLGRPLTFGVFRENVILDDDYEGEKLETKFEGCKEFRFMASKLFGGKEYQKEKKIGPLYGMFNFAFGTNFLPSCVNKEDLVENHLMTLIEYLDEHELGAGYIIGGFLPEGVINFLSARYFAEFPDSLTKIISSSVKYGLCDTGNFCELLAQFILLFNYFFCIDEHISKGQEIGF